VYVGLSFDSETGSGLQREQLTTGLWHVLRACSYGAEVWDDVSVHVAGSCVGVMHATTTNAKVCVVRECLGRFRCSLLHD